MPRVTITNPYTPAFEASQDWRKTMPQPGPVPKVHLPVPATFTLGERPEGSGRRKSCAAGAFGGDGGARRQ